MKLFRFRPPGLESVEVAEQAVGLEQRPTRNDSRIGAIKDPQYRPPKPGEARDLVANERSVVGLRTRSVPFGWTSLACLCGTRLFVDRLGHLKHAYLCCRPIKNSGHRGTRTLTGVFTPRVALALVWIFTNWVDRASRCT